MSGLIDLDSDFAKQIGFTSDKFYGYLWREGDRIFISAILSKRPGKGNFSRLLESIESRNLQVVVPNPLRQMQKILERKGFVLHVEHDPQFGEVEIWKRH